MTSGHSVTGWIGDLERGDAAAMQAIWDRFYPVIQGKTGPLLIGQPVS